MKTRTKTLSLLVFFMLFSMMRTQEEDVVNCHPTQIHISFGDIYYSISQDPAIATAANINNNQAYLVWHSLDASCTFAVTITDLTTNQVVSTVSADYYADFFYDFAAPDAAISSYTTNNGTYSTVSYTALFKGLEYEKNYAYVISDMASQASEGPFTFRLPTPFLKTTSRKIFLAGDLDAFENGLQTIQSFRNMSEVSFDEYGSWIMMGDAGYDVETDNGTRGDAYFQAVQSFSGRWLSSMALGNHDIYADWSFMNLRIRNPLFNVTQNHYFSYNQEGIHFTFLNLDYYDRASADIQTAMYNWIDNDLSVANSAANREKWPWVIFIAHRPIYCGYREQGEQDIPPSAWCYSFYEKRKIWDELLHKYSVDLMLTAHKHSYERMGPIYQNKSVAFTKLDNDPLSHNIIDPQATVHIMEGSGGNVWYTPEPYQAEGWAIVADVNPGYGVFYVQNNADNLTLSYEHISSATGQRIDYMNLVRTRPQAADEGGISGWVIVIIVLIVGTVIGFGYSFWRKKQQEQEDRNYDYSRSIPLIELKR